MPFFTCRTLHFSPSGLSRRAVILCSVNLPKFFKHMNDIFIEIEPKDLSLLKWQCFLYNLTYQRILISLIYLFQLFWLTLLIFNFFPYFWNCILITIFLSIFPPSKPSHEPLPFFSNSLPPFIPILLQAYVYLHIHILS